MATRDDAGRIPSPRTENFRQAIKLAISLVLFYGLALILNWDLAKYGALAIVLCNLGTRGASLEKATARVIGTTAGVLIGFVLISVFHQDRWLMLSAFVFYLPAVGYFMQGSRNSYAWYVAAFLPLVVWGSNYPDFDNTFYFGTFRWLQTTVGILIYTVIDLVLWPRSAGDRVGGGGQQLWTEMKELFSAFSSRIHGEPVSATLADLRGKTAGTLAEVNINLQQAFYDTPEIRSRKKQWQAWQSNTSGMLNALEMALDALEDCQGLELQHLIPQLPAGLELIESRIDAIDGQWSKLFSADEIVADAKLVRPVSWTIDTDQAKKLTDAERARLAYFLAQLHSVERTSRRVLRSLEQIVASDFGPESNDTFDAPGQFRSLPWIQQRLTTAMFPAVAFAVAFMLWILINPPAGPRMPMMVGILALVLVRTQFNPAPLVIAMVLNLFIAVAPVYWLIMPAISTSVGLLGLVFVYSLFFGCLGGINPVFKLAPLIMFVSVAGISNQQRYSFQGPVDAALMWVIAGTLVAIIYPFFAALRPERRITLWTDRFFQGCAEVVSSYPSDDAGDSPVRRARRVQSLESMVLPAPSIIRRAIGELDHHWFPAETSERLSALSDSMQRTVNRLIGLEEVLDQVDPQNARVHASVQLLRGPIEEAIPKLPLQYSSLTQAGGVLPEELANVIRTDLESQAVRSVKDPQDQQTLVECYTVLGSVRGLIDAMLCTRKAMAKVKWESLFTPRF